ncbi:hypothetical protein PYW07_006791 [Mythimna separata]|uniref:Uncharacterized protein n=1 Tax=Mythimna separata TaxID=271217 RepID=A0AAD7Z1V4_MYTSE|nr:hypothetical protein PYW07_006791 [Mythimna separata]
MQSAFPSASKSALPIPPCVFSPERVVDGPAEDAGIPVAVTAGGDGSQSRILSESSPRRSQSSIGAAPVERAESLLIRAQAMGAEVEEAMGKSGNLKREIKSTINKNIIELLQIIASLVSLAKSSSKEERGANGMGDTEVSTQTGSDDGAGVPTMVDVLKDVRESRKQIAECALYTRTLCEKLDNRPPAPLSSPRSRSYASVAAGADKQYVPQRPLHSLIVSSEDTNDTSGAVVDKIRIAVDAKETGIRVDKVRKAEKMSQKEGLKQAQSIGATKRLRNP